MKTSNTPKNTNFNNLLAETLEDFSWLILINSVCDYIETIDEGFKEEFGRRKDLDWYYGSLLIKNDKLDNAIRILSRKFNVTDPELVLKRLFITMVKLKSIVPIVSPFIKITEKGKEVTKMVVGVGVEPDQTGDIVGREDIDWSESLDKLFKSLQQFKLLEKFKRQEAVV